ncbi:PAS domain-containing sensor histidine kinase [Variovorax sp. J22P271]|uniref:sensor histidine kinase n=1 Tax=Variovorax davisae TaxID=3053515 RepID=UPI0025778BE9|nr:PAS domain-containing sensor histidine kinase [Variovorax sp. J22P271]MDM0032194.1 PAS domain-containing sensor histidine kinase [Variovorax sp. J22P271]
MSNSARADSRHNDGARIIVLCGEPSPGRSAVAASVVEQARRVDGDAYVTTDHDDLLDAVNTALQSAGALLLVIDPGVRQPVDIARRVTRNWPQVWILLALTGERLVQTRRMADRAEPNTSRWIVRPASDDGELVEIIAKALANAGHQHRLRANLNRLRQRMAPSDQAAEAEYKRLIESDRYVATAVESSLDAVISLDRHGRVVSWNHGATQLFGLTREQARETALAAQFEDADAFEAACGLAMLNGNSSTTFRTVPTAGAQFVEATFDRIADNVNFALGLVVILRDVTSRQQAEQELRDSYDRKDQFFTLLGHELRNPLAPIRTAAELLNRLPLADPRAKLAVGTLIKQTALMGVLLDDLLDVARISRGGLQLKLEQFDLRSVLDDALEQSRPLIDDKHQTVGIEVQAEASCQVVGDRQRLVQVFSNILTNASKYSDDGGRIDLVTTVVGDKIGVAVTDNGIGLDPDMVTRVFDLFSQAQAGHARSRGGLGLGLSIVKSLVEQHGGSISAFSAGLGQGSTFRVELPCWAPANAAAGVSDLGGHI